MRALLLVMAAVSLTTQAYGFECPFGKEGALQPVRWSAKPSGSFTSLGLGVRSTFEKPISMVDAGVWFVDGLGRLVGEGFELDPDLKFHAGGAVITQIRAQGAERMVDAKFEEFTAHICTKAVLFEDGTMVEF